MKFLLEHYVVIGLFIVVLMISSYGPFHHSFMSANSRFHKSYSQFEGFENYPESINSHVNPASLTAGNVEKDNSGSLSVFGFDGLYSAPLSKDVPIDPLYNAMGSPTCTGASSGYSDSRGGLCLSQPMVRLFNTRGGNQSGAPSQIGASTA